MGKNRGNKTQWFKGTSDAGSDHSHSLSSSPLLERLERECVCVLCVRMGRGLSQFFSLTACAKKLFSALLGLQLMLLYLLPGGKRENGGMARILIMEFTLRLQHCWFFFSISLYAEIFLLKSFCVLVTFSNKLDEIASEKL